MKLVILITVLFSIVTIGAGLKIMYASYEDPASGSTFTIVALIYFLLSSYLIPGILHPFESYSLIHAPLYILTNPPIQFLLMIYALCQLNNISWGTRDTKMEFSSTTETENIENNDKENSWITDEELLKTSERIELMEEETQFWKELIPKYLLPLSLNEDEKVLIYTFAN